MRLNTESQLLQTMRGEINELVSEVLTQPWTLNSLTWTSRIYYQAHTLLNALFNYINYEVYLGRTYPET